MEREREMMVGTRRRRRFDRSIRARFGAGECRADALNVFSYKNNQHTSILK